MTLIHKAGKYIAFTLLLAAGSVNAQVKHSIQLNAGIPSVESIVPAGIGYSLEIHYKYNLTKGLSLRPSVSICNINSKASDPSTPLSYSNTYYQYAADAMLDMEKIVQLHELSKKLNLYAVLGAGYIHSNARPEEDSLYLKMKGIRAVKLKQMIFYFSIGAELHYYLNPLTDLALGTSISMTSTRFLTGYQKPLGDGYYNNYSVSNIYLGLKFKLPGKNKKQQYDWATDQEIRQDNPELLFRDSDKDGVPDLADQDNNTPFGIRVDTKGIAIDTDYDGVPDFRDNCPMVSGSKTNKGCPADSIPGLSPELKEELFRDTDNDGVVDAIDTDNSTPPGVRVDTRGVELDSDGDGIPDSKDNCPFIKGTVEKNGC